MTGSPDLTRRQLLGQAGMTGAIALAPGVTLYAMAEDANAAASDTTRWGLLIDTNKCKKGCSDCVTACNKENGLGPAKSEATRAQWIRKIDLTHNKTGRESSLPVMCQHCDTPPCVDVCPTGASMKRADSIVLVDKHICIGCRYCMMACPFKARSFVHEPVHDQSVNAPRGMGTVEACTLCVHRIDKGRIPACVESCEAAGHSAILFGDLKDPDSPISKALEAYPSIALRDDLGLNPAVRYQNP